MAAKLTYGTKHVLEGHTRAVSVVKFNPSGDLLASASADTTIRITRVEDGSLACVLPKEDAEVYHGHLSGINDLVWSNDGRYLCSASDDGTIIIWDVDNQSAHSKLKGHEHHVFSLSMHPCGNSIVSGDYTGCIRIWDFKNGKNIKTISNAHVEPVTCVEYNSDDPCYIASGSFDGTCRIFQNYAIQKTIHTKTRPPVSFVKFSPNGKYILVSSLDSHLRLWDYKNALNPKVVRDYEGHANKEYCLYAKFSITCGKHVVSGSEDGSVFIWDVSKKNVVQKLEGHKDVVLAVDCHPKRNIIASGSSGAKNKDFSVRLWGFDPPGSGTGSETEAAA